jgi:hypothetical protein
MKELYGVAGNVKNASSMQTMMAIRIGIGYENTRWSRAFLWSIVSL